MTSLLRVSQQRLQLLVLLLHGEAHKLSAIYVLASII